MYNEEVALDTEFDLNYLYVGAGVRFFVLKIRASLNIGKKCRFDRRLWLI